MSFDLSIPPEILAEAEAASKGGFNLEVPVQAEKERNRGYASWNEYATIESVYRDLKEIDGQKIVSFVVKTKIIPFNDSPNGGRRHTDFNRVNYSAIHGEKVVPPEKLAGQIEMSRRTITRLKQLAVLAGMDLATGMNEEILGVLFPLPGTAEDMTAASPLIGMVITMGMVDNSGKQVKGANSQNTETYGPGPDGLNV